MGKLNIDKVKLALVSARAASAWWSAGTGHFLATATDDKDGNQNQEEHVKVVIDFSHCVELQQ